MDKLTDPKSFGPGIWFTLHTTSLTAVDTESKKAFAAMVKSIIHGIKCEECHGHATAYLEKNPIEKFFNIKDDKTSAEIGCFKWTWIFHNAVNRRLQKKEIDFQTALMMYAKKETCKDCTSKPKSDRSETSTTESTRIGHRSQKDIDRLYAQKIIPTKMKESYR
jgi:hypothetical protein